MKLKYLIRREFKMVRNEVLVFSIPVAVELTGIFILILGIAVEISTGGEIGHILISVGSSVIAAGSILWSKILKPKGKKG
jgi:hypothetical protein